MTADHTWMQRALQLARCGAGWTAPNPLVGAVLVQGDRILAEGWHMRAGGPHAEVHCLQRSGDGVIPADATLYVSLEPCSHHGRTPPCTDLLIARGVRRVVVAHADPNPAVSGRGMERLRAAGVDVVVGIGEGEARWTNRRFLSSIQHHRPYIILKWARSTDGYIDQHPRGPRGVQRISSPESDVLVHTWRAEEQAILVGSQTVINDDPSLSVRQVEGPDPLRVVLDREGRSPAGSHVFDGSKPTLLFTAAHRPELPVEQQIIGIEDDPLDHILSALNTRGIRSLLVEGGARLLGHFLSRGLWDEARIISGTPWFGKGTPAPSFPHTPQRTFDMQGDRISLHINPASPIMAQVPDHAWPW